MVYFNECIDVNTALKNPSNDWVVQVGCISFQEISYAGKLQVVSRYIFSNLWWQTLNRCLWFALYPEWHEKFENKGIWDERNAETATMVQTATIYDS